MPHKDNEARLNAIIETAIDGIITIDDRGLMESANLAAINIFGYEEHELLGQNIKMLMPQPDRAKHDSYLHNYQTTGIKKIIGIGREVLGQKKDGSTFPFRLSVSEVKLHGKIIYTGIIHDITKLKEAENAYLKLNTELENRVQQRTADLFEAIKSLKQINEKQKQAEQEIRNALSKEKQLNDLKSKFVTIASHEFRTPLSTILSSASLIAKYKDKGDLESIDKHVDRIKSSVSNLTVILNDFLSLSKLEEGIISNNPTSFNLQELIIELQQELEPMLNDSQELECKFEGALMVLLDKNILRNILLNLISNAIKYSAKGKIVIKLKTANDSIHLSVIDTGIGISEEDMPFIFTRFFRAHNAGTIPGTGLGLNIVKRYVELINGSISIQSKLNQGTTVSIDIKL